MKTNLRQKAKSALSILLTLCMIFSVLTVGIASTSAAEVDNASVGFSDLTTVIFDNSKTNWSSVYLYICETGYVRSYQMTASDNSSVYVKTGLGQWTNRQNMFFASIGNYDGGSTYTNANTASISTLASGGNYTARIDASNSDAKHIFYPASGSNNAALNKADAYVIASGTDNGQTYSQITTSSWSSTADIMNYNGTSYTRTYENKDAATYSLDVVKYDDWNTKCTTAGTMTGCTSSTANNNMTITITNKSDIAVSFSDNKINVTATLKKIAAPTNVRINNSTSASVNASSSSSTLTWTAVSGADSYEIYKDGTKVGTSTTTSYSITNSTANAGSYTVKAVPTDSSYLTSDASDSATLTVYEPLYCLVGNVDKGSIKIGDTVFTPTAPSGSASYWNTWQDGLTVGDATATPGVYKITFTANEEAERTGNPNIGLYLKNTGQKAFILNDTAYNTSGSDLTITDDGIVDDDNLYVNNLGTPAGGSLVLKRGQTYTITIDQTQRYNNSSSYPWGKITITTTDVFADVAAKKQVFNATSGVYEAVADCESAIGTATAQPVHNAGSLTTQLTAVDVNSNYDFIGWYKDDAACTGDPTIAASACTKTDNTYTTSVTIDKTAAYYALFKQKQPTQYNVTLTQPSYGTISTTDGVTSGKAYQGATVSLNATVTDPSKEFSHWLITNASNVDITSTVCANPTLQTTTFTMPALDVNVTAIYSNKTQVTITTSSNNTSLGTADYTSGTYYVGDRIPISATNVGGVFSRWVVTGGTVANAGSASTTIVATGSTVTARAIFDYKTYQLFSDKDTAGITKSAMYTLVRQDDGTYVSTRTVDTSTGSFTIYDVSAKTYAVPGDSDFEFNTGYFSRNNSSWSSSASTYKYKIKSGLSGEYYVVFDPSTGSYGNVSVTTTNPMGTIAQVYAKDGTIRYANGGTASGGGASSGELWSNGGDITAKKGVTVITKINSTAVPNPDTTRYPDTVADSDHLKIYSAPIGSTITIQTTLNDTYKNQGFYVGMFVINGWKVAASDAGKGVYTATYTLTDEYAENNLSSEKSFEITPVYYNKNFQYVTFYVDADSVPQKWKGTISTCADYRSTDGQSAASSHFEGSYPGQPLGREGDLYEIKVAKYFYKYSSSTGEWSAQTNYYPSATITAYNYDSVHHYYYVYGDENVNTSNNKNYQTYDFADFSYLAQIKDIEAILFRCKYETDYSSWQIYNVADNNANYDPNSTAPSWDNVSTNTGMLNTWQWLTDYYGNPIDAFGNRIVKSGSGDSAEYYTAEDIASLVPYNNDQVRIVSYGNKMSTGTSTVRTKAQWATGWVVYTHGSTSGTKYYKAYGTPADFICTTPGDTSTSNAKYYSGGSASDIEGKLTIISYDKERTNKISGVGDTGERIDGQWYYSAQHEFDSTVQVHFTTATGTAVKTSDTAVDADSSTAGSNDGWEGTTSKTVATLDGKTTETYSNVTTEAALNCTLGSGYTFVGWYIYDGSTYTKIGDNFADQNTTMTMKKNYTIVAVVRAVAAGDLVITHSRYTGSKPEAHDGTGKYYVSAVLNKGTASEKTIAEAQNSITVSGLKATDKLTITIRTVCNGADTFYAWYEEALGADYSRTGNYYEICSETEDPLGESEVSYTFFEADCSTFFNGNSLARQTIDLYSDIVHVSAYATLTYKYYDRFAQNGANQMVSYVVKDVPLNDTEIENGYIPSDDKIALYAPKVVDTIYTDTKWTITGTKVERAASNVTLMATQTPKTCFVEYIPNAQVATYLLAGKTTEVSVGDVVAWNTRIVDYNSWLIDENADMSNPNESDFYVSAPETYTDATTEKTWTFLRFDVYEYDRLTGKVGDVLYSSNDHTFGYRIYADCVIYPVYTNQETVTKQLTAKIEPAVLNREVYGDSLSPTDKLYADLLISFINVAVVTGNAIPEEIKDLAAGSGYTIETGFVLNKKVILSDTDFNTLKTAAETGATDTTDTILATYSSQFNQTEAASVAKGTNVNGYSKYVLDNSKLTNKNRTDGVVRFTNSETAQKKVYAAYSYIIINKGSTEYAFAISDAQLFNFCYLGNKPLKTVS